MADHAFLPVSESRSSVRTGLEEKEIFRFMEGFAFPSFPNNSLRSSFGVLVYGDNLSLLCGNEEKRRKTAKSVSIKQIKMYILEA